MHEDLSAPVVGLASGRQLSAFGRGRRVTISNKVQFAPDQGAAVDRLSFRDG
ncbi:hypothetical protein NXC24_PB00483 (plasmid) [Rhizobium sp. NXC24]|nr:hypothetical protein NXC24_PB00483 [Rhizobium sp. NXC24]